MYKTSLPIGDAMKHDEKTREHLVHEPSELRSQNTALNKSITGSISSELVAEEAHRYAEGIVETVREPLLVLDADLKIVSANRHFYRTFKVTPGETIGSFIYDLGNKQWDIPKFRELLEEILPEKETFDDFEVSHNFEDIGHKIMLLNARQIYRKDIGTKMILLAIEDITERKQLESLLTDSEEQYRRLFETANDGIVLLEKREGKIVHANPATEKLLGYTEKESIGNKLQDIGVVLDRNDFQTTMQELNQIGIINYRNINVETKSGQLINTEIYLVDRAKLVQCNIRDITERKRAEQTLRESEEKFRWLVDNMADVITVMDLNLRFTYVSPSIIRMRGYTAEEAVAQTIEQVMSPESLQMVAKIFEEEMKLEASGTADPDRSRILELEQYRKDGSIVLMENHLSFMRDEARNPVGIISLSHDITDRKRVEEALRESEELLRSYLENAPDGIYMSDLEATFLYGNRKCEEITGYQREELIGKNFIELKLLSENDLKKAVQLLQVNMQGKSTGPDEMELISKGGRLIPVEINTNVIQRMGQKIVLSSVRDITGRRKAEESLKVTLESLRKALSTIIQVMVSAVEARDPYTAGHQSRSADLARAIATEMEVPQERIEGIRMAGLIHDIGKLSIPSEILSKPTKLSNLEFSLIKVHPEKGYEMLKDVESPWPLAEIVYQHHERMDGSGYPRKLKRDEILMEARIMAVADVVESMASHRPYRSALGLNAALEEIESNRGTLYDADAVDACLRLFGEKRYHLQ